MGTEQFGDMVHRDCITPISQHLERDRDGLVWCVSLFGQQAADTLGEVLERHNRFYLKKGNIVLAVTDRIRQPIPDVEQLLQLGEDAAEGTGWIFKRRLPSNRRTILLYPQPAADSAKSGQTVERLFP